MTRYILMFAFALMGMNAVHAQIEHWKPAGKLLQARHYFLTEILPSGEVLIIGGIVGTSRFADGARLDGDATTSCEIYDPVTQTSRVAAELTGPHSEAASVQTKDGHVIVIGGLSTRGKDYNCSDLIERYDPEADEWTALGRMSGPRRRHSAVLLDDDNILIVGGANGNVTTDAAEIFMISKGTTRLVDPFPMAIKEGTLVMLDGIATYVGGRAHNANSDRQRAIYIFVPSHNTWISRELEGSLPSGATIIAQHDGTMIMSGGAEQERPPVFSRNVVRMIGTRLFTLAHSAAGRIFHGMVSTGRNSVIISGGFDEYLQPLSSTELLDIPNERIINLMGMRTPRAHHKLVVLDENQDGLVVLAFSGVTRNGAPYLTPTVERLVLRSETEALAGKTTPVDKFSGESLRQVYPNPTTGPLTVPASAGATVRIMDAMGRVRFTEIATLETAQMDLSGCPVGVYIVQVAAAGKTQKYRVIKS